MRAVPSTCRTAGMRDALSGATSWTKSMNGDTSAPMNQRRASSSMTTGATGRKSSRSLISLSRACMSAWIGDARMLRAPRAHLHPPLEPPDPLFPHEDVGDLVRDVREPPVGHLRPAEEVFDLLVRVLG